MNNTKSEKKKESNYMKITLSYILMIFFLKKSLRQYFFFSLIERKLLSFEMLQNSLRGAKL